MSPNRSRRPRSNFSSRTVNTGRFRRSRCSNWRATSSRTRRSRGTWSSHRYIYCVDRPGRLCSLVSKSQVFCVRAHTRTEKMLVCLGGPIQGTFICSDAQLETESRGQDGCFLVKLPSPDSTISFEVSGCQRGVLASDPIRHPRARANFGVCVGLQKTTFGGDADFRVRACRDD